MKQYVLSLVLGLGLSSSVLADSKDLSLDKQAGYPICKAVEAQCEYASDLSEALKPYYEIARNNTVLAYKKAHDTIAEYVPANVINATAPYLSEANARSMLAHSVLGFAGVMILQAVKAVTSIPVAILTNRGSMFLAGVVAKSIYDSYNREEGENK